MVWDWQVWRCFDDVAEIFEVKGWESGFFDRTDNEVMPLVGEYEELLISFAGMDRGTGECWFELRDKSRPPVAIVEGTHNVPTPERAAQLLADHVAALKEASAPHDRPLYEPAEVKQIHGSVPATIDSVQPG